MRYLYSYYTIEQIDNYTTQKILFLFRGSNKKGELDIFTVSRFKLKIQINESTFSISLLMKYQNICIINNRRCTNKIFSICMKLKKNKLMVIGAFF